MQTTPVWAKALQISKASIEEWLTVAPIEESFTFWCLFTGRLSLSAYFEWAKETYGLAYLEEGYFQQLPNRELWKQIHSVANWSPWMLPIEQWDGVVFIACVEPPTEMQWSFPVAFVLADPNLLEQRWQKLHTTNDNGATATLTLIKENEAKQTEATEISSVVPVPTEPTPVAPPQPAPVVVAQKVATPTIPAPEINIIKNVAAPIDLGNAAPPPLPKIGADDMPLGLNQASAPPGDGSPAGLSLSGLKPSADAPPPVPSGSPLKLDLVGLNSVQLDPAKGDLKKPVSPIQLDMPEATPAPIQAPNIPKATSATPVPPAPVVNVDVMAAALNIALAPDQIEKATTEDECLAWFFKQVRTRYHSAIALVFSKNSLHTWKWDSVLVPKNANAVITFDTPSLFRIVARTKRSYHGYVVDNPAHQTFFQVWNLPKVPVHVTGVPILMSGQFRGMFVCNANEPMGPDALEFIEMVADKTVVQLGKLKGALTQAA